MIPDLPKGISDEDLLEFYSTVGGNLSDQSTIHIRWWTHRQNPSICWICDQNILISKLIALAGRYITKSTVDMETSSMSENDSDTEIEENLEDEFLNRDDEPVPEYEVEDAS